VSEPITSWDLFVLRHAKRGNLILHFVSWLMFFGGPLLALLSWNAWWLTLFLASGAVGAAGHYVFKDSGVSLREATSTPGVPLYVSRMFVLIARGEYAEEVRRARRKVMAHTRSERSTPAPG